MWYYQSGRTLRSDTPVDVTDARKVKHDEQGEDDAPDKCRAGRGRRGGPVVAAGRRAYNEKTSRQADPTSPRTVTTMCEYAVPGRLLTLERVFAGDCIFCETKLYRFRPRNFEAGGLGAPPGRPEV